VIRSAEYISQYDDRGFSMTSWDHYQVVECQGCRTLSFRKMSQNTENSDFDPETGEEELHQTIELFPNRLEGRTEIADAWQLPPAMQRIYSETLSALRASLPVLAGVGIRALVETVCKDCDAQGKNLELRIDNLVEKGVLTKAGSEILHSLRLMGNQAAHEVKPHTVADLNVAFDVIEYVLTGVYLLPKRAEKLPKRASPKER
jgi:hypothetical protein